VLLSLFNVVLGVWHMETNFRNLYIHLEMKNIKIHSPVMLAILLLAAACSTNEKLKPASEQAGSVSLDKAKLNGDEKISTPYGEIELQHTYMTDESSQKLYDAMDLQRATQAYIWSTPLVSFGS